MKHSSLASFVTCAICAASAASHAAAGDVQATVKNGSLRIRGTADADRFTIDQTGLPKSSFAILPVAPTTVNGLAASITLSGVQHDALLSLGAGDDEVTIQNLTVSRNLVVSAGDGNDKLLLGYMTVEHATRLRLGEGDNSPTIDHCELDGPVSVRGGAGIDLVKLQLSELHSAFDARLGTTAVNAMFVDTCEIGGAFSVRAGTANDIANIYSSKLMRDCSLRLGEGANILHLGESEYFGDVHEVCGKLDPGYNTLAILNNAHFHRDLRLDFGGTGTTINAFGTMVDRDWIVTGGENGGNDGWIVANDVVGRDLRWSAGAGMNLANLTNVEIGRNFTVLAGGDADLFYSDGITGVNTARIALGGGANAITVLTKFEARRASIATGPDGDTLDLAYIKTQGDLAVALGAGINNLKLDWLTIGDDLLVRSGDGDDTITLTNSAVAGQTKFAHGGGNDVVP